METNNENRRFGENRPFDDSHPVMKHHHPFKTMLVGIIIVAFGLMIMLRNMGVISPFNWHVIFSWPMLLVVLGIVNLGERKYSWGMLLLAVGGIFLADRYYDLPYNLFSLFWPVVIIIAGLSIIFSRTLRQKHFHRWNRWQQPDISSTDGDFLDEAAIFGGSERFIHSQNFRGGKVVCIFGGSKLDLTQCQLAPGVNVLELTAIFGGMTMLVPNDWNVKVESFNAFGGFADKRRNVNVDPDKILVIKGATVFGGGELKSY